MSKFKEKYLVPTVFRPNGHWMVGTIWPVKGSKGNEYSVELHDKGFNCDCPGFTFRGSCKHSQAILKQVEGAMQW